MKKIKRISQIILGIILMILQIAICIVDRFISAFLFWLPLNPIKSSVMTIKELTPIFIRVGIFGLFYLIYNLL
mgnify:CR=1 FL=1